MLKALSIRQPWASLIASGRKTLEVRTWRTSYRGPMVICASTAPDVRAINWFEKPDEPRGCTICLVDLIDVRRGTPEDEIDALCDPSGYFVWVLKRPRRLEQVPVKGRLSVWEIDKRLVRVVRGARTKPARPHNIQTKGG